MTRTLVGLLAAALLSFAPQSASAGIDLQGIDLQGIDLQGIDLQGIDLQGIDLQGIDLQGIDLQGIDLQGIDLQGIDLQGIDLQGATILGYALDGSSLQVTAYLGSSRGTHVWVIYARSSVTLITLDRRGQVSSTAFRRGFGSITFEVFKTRSTDSVTFRLTNVGNDMSFNTMGRNPNGSNADVTLHTLEAQTDGGSWVNVCGPGNTVVVLQGGWTNGVYSSEGLSFSCSGVGVAAKCVQQWGYKPWKSLPYGPLDVSLDPLFHACTRAAMADYCGDGFSYTQPDTPVDIFDFWDFNSPASDSEVAAYGASIGEPDFSIVLESVLDADGTVAHHQERYGEDAPLFCDGNVVWSYPTQDQLWDVVISDLVPWPSADQYGMDWPYIGVRSSPTVWQNPNLLIDFDEGLSCPSEFGPCPL